MDAVKKYERLKGENDMADVVEIKVKHVITLSERKIKESLEAIIYCQIKLMQELNTTGAYTESECSSRLKDIERRNLMDAVLREFGIQSFQYFKTDYKIEIK